MGSFGENRQVRSFGRPEPVEEPVEVEAPAAAAAKPNTIFVDVQISRESLDRLGHEVRDAVARAISDGFVVSTAAVLRLHNELANAVRAAFEAGILTAGEPPAEDDDQQDPEPT